MDRFERVIAAVSVVRTPLSITAIVLIVFYYLVQQMLSLGIFSTLTGSDTALFINNALSKVFYLAVLGLFVGAGLFALPYVAPKRRGSKVNIVDASINDDLGPAVTKGKRTNR
jgi:hypothetical protein